MIYLCNGSSVVSDSDLEAELPAYTAYEWQVRSWWETAAQTLKFCPSGHMPPTESWQIWVLDDSDTSGALGYHDFTPGGRPIAKVFAKTDQEYGYSRTVTLTHELAELICDPWVSRAEQAANTRFYAAEVCDPVENDAFAYNIKTHSGLEVLVSDFITPYWFVPTQTTGKFDHAGHCTAPLQILAGGYAYIYEYPAGWSAIDENGQKKTAAELPDRHRLQQYARDRGDLPC